MERTYDLIVVGAGVIGLSCGWRCAQAGMSVLVLDRGGLAAGASGVAAGMLAPVTEASFGEEGLLRLNLASRAEWPAFAAELERAGGRPTSYSDSGALVVAADRDDVEELQRLHRFQVELGLGSEWLGARAARELEPGLSPRIGGAIHAPQEGSIDPRAVVAALAAAFEAAGGNLRLETEVVALDTTGGRIGGVVLEGGEAIDGGAVLVAAGAWSSEGGLGAELAAPRVRPVKGQLLELRVRRTRRAPARALVRTPRCYVVSRPDGRVVIGATQEEQGFDTSITAEGVYQLLEAAREVVPEIGELELVRTHAGLRPSTPDNCPAVGPGDIEGLAWATGHYRNGVLLAPLTGSAIASLLSGNGLPEIWEEFAPGRFDEVQL